MQNLVVEKEMKIAVERLSWKEIFDKTEQNRKIGYDVMYCEDIEILVPKTYGKIDLSASEVKLNWIFDYENKTKDETNGADTK